tara:strand:+ start:304 stop:507 length:204 start_codon:yes stop_codon:yes gene_type:complete
MNRRRMIRKQNEEKEQWYYMMFQENCKEREDNQEDIYTFQEYLTRCASFLNEEWEEYCEKNNTRRLS